MQTPPTSTAQLSVRSRARAVRRVRAERSVLAALIGSRLLVLATGILAARLVALEPNWWWFDPLRMSEHLGRVGNVLAAASVRWDSIHYLDIVHHGYAHAGDTVFFPFYPLLVSALGWVLGSDVLAGILISTVSFAVALVLLHRLAELELGRRAADATVLLLAFAPLAFYFTALYTESLFLALSVGAVYAARREQWELAGILAALASVTRIPGLLLVVPIGVMFLRRHRGIDWRLGWLLPAPSALAGFLAYLASRGYGWLAPVKQQTTAVHAHTLAGPVHTVALAVSSAWDGVRWLLHGHPVFTHTVYGPFPYPIKNLELLGFLVVALAALVLSFRHLRFEYGLYAALLIVVCIWSPIPAVPIQGFDRYTLAMFPLWMGAGAWLSDRRLTPVAVALSVPLLVFFTFEFATWTFIA